MVDYDRGADRLSAELEVALRKRDVARARPLLQAFLRASSVASRELQEAGESFERRVEELEGADVLPIRVGLTFRLGRDTGMRAGYHRIAATETTGRGVDVRTTTHLTTDTKVLEALVRGQASNYRSLGGHAAIRSAVRDLRAESEFFARQAGVSVGDLRAYLDRRYGPG